MRNDNLRKEFQQKEFVGLLDTYGFLACFSDPTRVTENSKDSIVIFSTTHTNNFDSIQYVIIYITK